MSGTGMGAFGHVPTPDEINARAFASDREAQPDGWWPGYVAGLRDAKAVDDGQAYELLIAALEGQFAHNTDPIFDYELEGETE